MPPPLDGNDTAPQDVPLAKVFDLRRGRHDGVRHLRLSPADDGTEPADIVDLAAMAGVAPGIEEPAVAEMFLRDPDAYEHACRARVEAAAESEPEGHLAKKLGHLKRTE